jgi:hypothetical protein
MSSAIPVGLNRQNFDIVALKCLFKVVRHAFFINPRLRMQLTEKTFIESVRKNDTIDTVTVSLETRRIMRWNKTSRAFTLQQIIIPDIIITLENLRF